MRVKNWDYRELRERIADGYTLRSFTDFLSQVVPKHDAFHRAFTRLTPPTLAAVNQLVVQAAIDLGLEDGKDSASTVVEADIHHPTDNTLLWETVRVITRLIGRLDQAIRQGIKGFRNRRRAARRPMQKIMTAKERHHQQTKKYPELIVITDEVVESARQVLRQTRKTRGKGMIEDIAIAQLRKQIECYCQLGDPVIDQARRRVLEGEPVPNRQSIPSSNSHTDLIKRGKVLTPAEFGHKVCLAESAQGLITQYEVLDGNPCDEDHVETSLECHRETFGHAPELYGSDRGFYSENNIKACQQEGAKVVCMPQLGERRLAIAQLTRRARPSKRGSASELVSKGASPFCSAGVA